MLKSYIEHIEIYSSSEYIFFQSFTADSTFPKSLSLSKKEWPGTGNLRVIVFEPLRLKHLLPKANRGEIFILACAWITPSNEFWTVADVGDVQGCNKEPNKLHSPLFFHHPLSIYGKRDLLCLHLTYEHQHWGKMLHQLSFGRGTVFFI